MGVINMELHSDFKLMNEAEPGEQDHRIVQKHCSRPFERGLLSINLFHHLAAFALDEAEELVVSA